MPAVGQPGYWPKQKLNLAPRLSIAYSPDSKTSIRAGAGIYYAFENIASGQNVATNAPFNLSK